MNPKVVFSLSFVFLVHSALEVSGKQLVEISERDIQCYENGRFYRNPERPPSKLWTNSECSKYYLCLDGDVFEFKCSVGLLFDVSRQICDFKQNVHNCELTAEVVIPKPLLELAQCADGELGCADGSCLPAEYFCDGSTDCPDSSDEVPQMILLTFDDAVNFENWELYTKQLFTQERKNPNGCAIRSTLFVSHQYTNYMQVQKMWNDGHEIAVHSITHRGPEEWWSKNATIEEWFDEMVGQANIINRFANVRMEDLRGMRAPYLRVGWNRQFLMMKEFGFVYDASMVAPRSDPPLWPYTLDHKMPHKCIGNGQSCPSRSYPGVWELVMNQLQVGEHACAMVDSCPPHLSGDDVYRMFSDNFRRHYTSNRAPLGLYFHTAWFKRPEYLAAFKRFLDDMQKLPDVYFVTGHQAIEWMKRPTATGQLGQFEPWQCRPRHLEPAELACSLPNTCKLPSRVLHQDRYMLTCNECPKSYPWLRNEFGFD